MRQAMLLVALVASGCQPEATQPDARQKDAHVDAPPPPWWRPTPGSVDKWDIQLASPFDVHFARDAYILNLWDLVPAPMMIDYGDGMPVVVPMGTLGAKMQDLHAQRPRTIVICRFDAGALDLDDPDAVKFPGYAASPPDEPAMPDAASAIGWSATLPPHTRWLDIDRKAAMILPLIEKRFELAKQIGCDAVLPDHVDMFAVKRTDNGGMPGDGTGFPRIGTEQNVAYYSALVPFAHGMRELSIGFRGNVTLGNEDVQRDFDWALADSCGEHDECDLWNDAFGRSAFGAKAILALEYDHIVEMRGPGQFCIAQTNDNITDGIVKDEALSSAHWQDCPNPTTTTDAGQ